MPHPSKGFSHPLFYIPRIDRERTFYGSPFEVRLRNQLTQKAIAIECAEWVKNKVRFKSNITNNTLPGFIIAMLRCP